MQNKESILRRVRKLLALSESPNPNEAASAASMAAKIMAKYQIEHSEVILADLKNKDQVTYKDINVKGMSGRDLKRVPVWAGVIALQVAKLNDLGCLRYTDGFLRFYGYKTDIEVAGYTMEYLVNVVNKMTRAYYATTAVRNSYREGLARGIALKIMDEIKAKHSAVTETGTSLVVAKKSAISDIFGSRCLGEKTRRDKRVYNSYYQGERDGRNVDIGRRGIGSEKNRVTHDV